MKKLIVVFLGLILSLSLVSCKKDQEIDNGDVGDTPVDPANPNQPSQPVDPNQPSQPVDPNQPSQPVDPNQPSQPVDPNQPSQPVDPNQPSQPVDPALPTYETPEGYPFPQTNFEDGRNRVPSGLEVVPNGHDVIYIGDTFTGKGYDVYITYAELDNEGNEELPQFTCQKLDSFSIDDSRVDYQKTGEYYVEFQGRYKADYQTTLSLITIKADRYESLNQEHLIGIKCAVLIKGKVGITKDNIIPDEVYLILTENKYDDLGELITREQKIRNGWELDTEAVDFTKPGKYPVYVDYSCTYGNITITVHTFFTLELEA